MCLRYQYILMYTNFNLLKGYNEQFKKLLGLLHESTVGIFAILPISIPEDLQYNY